MDEELRDARLTLLLHCVLGFFIAYFSNFMGNSYISIPFGIALLVVFGHVTERIFGKETLEIPLHTGVFLKLGHDRYQPGRE